MAGGLEQGGWGLKRVSKGLRAGDWDLEGAGTWGDGTDPKFILALQEFHYRHFSTRPIIGKF